MTQVSFTVLDPCSECKSQNFKISGVIYNELYHYVKLTVRCMKCGEKKITIKDEIK